MLKLKNVSFAYAEEPVLKNIGFTLKKGENLSVIGESGCGKSTLLKLIYGLLHTDGKIFWEERELLGPNFNLVAQSGENGHPFRWKADSDSGLKRTPIPGQNGQ
ncbi:ATP-binding cassette domain-containing protein [Salegentibacter tibetensis]|uniref:ATP-binding cassette domain-containing protein n=1 Tax=Salegentibacter tibetensis TaxID=2873600 RepID=UPI00293D2ACD|nr:ATP-binding cassette domain-containing protein [Salegentibacter tibetensis]